MTLGIFVTGSSRAAVRIAFGSALAMLLPAAIAAHGQTSGEATTHHHARHHPAATGKRAPEHPAAASANSAGPAAAPSKDGGAPEAYAGAPAAAPAAGNSGQPKQETAGTAAPKSSAPGAAPAEPANAAAAAKGAAGAAAPAEKPAADAKSPLNAAVAETFVGQPVYGRKGDKIGELSQVVTGADGKVKSAVITWGGVFGFFQSSRTLDWAAADPVVKDGKLLLGNMTKDQVRNNEQPQASR